MSKSEAETCLINNCGKAANSRGLCSACLGAAYRMIRKDEKAEERLIQAGVLLRKKTTKRSHSKLSKHLEDATEGD